MKEPIVLLAVEQAGRAGAAAAPGAQYSTALTPLGKKKLPRRVPSAGTPLQAIQHNSPRWQPGPAAAGRCSGPHELCEVTQLQHHFLHWPLPPWQDEVPPRGTAACPCRECRGDTGAVLQPVVPEEAAHPASGTERG